MNIAEFIIIILVIVRRLAMLSRHCGDYYGMDIEKYDDGDTGTMIRILMLMIMMMIMFNDYDNDNV